MSLQQKITDVVTTIGHDIKALNTMLSTAGGNTVIISDTLPEETPKLWVQTNFDGTDPTIEPAEPEPTYNYDDQVALAWTYKDGGLKSRAGSNFVVKNYQGNYDRMGNLYKELPVIPGWGLYTHDTFVTLLQNTKFIKGTSTTPPTNWEIVYDTGTMEFPEVGKVIFSATNGRQVLRSKFLLHSRYNYQLLSFMSIFDGNTKLSDICRAQSDTVGGVQPFLAATVDGINVANDFTPTSGVHSVCICFSHGSFTWGVIEESYLYLGVGVASNITGTVTIYDIMLVDEHPFPKVVLTGENERFTIKSLGQPQTFYQTSPKGTSYNTTFGLKDPSIFDEIVDPILGPELSPNVYFDGPYTAGVALGLSTYGTCTAYEVQGVLPGHPSAQRLIAKNTLSGINIATGFDGVYRSRYLLEAEIKLFAPLIYDTTDDVIHYNSEFYGYDYSINTAKHNVIQKIKRYYTGATTQLTISHTGIDIYKLSVKKILGYKFTFCTQFKVPFTPSDHQLGNSYSATILNYLWVEYGSIFTTGDATEINYQWAQEDTIRIFSVTGNTTGMARIGYQIFDTNLVEKTNGIVWQDHTHTNFFDLTTLISTYLDNTVTPLYMQSLFVSKKITYTDAELISIMDDLS